MHPTTHRRARSLPSWSAAMSTASLAPLLNRFVVERVGALRYLPALFRLVYAASPRLLMASIALRLARASLPVLMLYLGKLILDAIVAEHARPHPAGTGIAGWMADPALARLAGLVAVELGLAILSDLLGRLSTPHRWAGRGPLRQCRHPAADAPRRRPRPRAIRGQRPAGSARTRPPAGDRALQPAVPALRAGAGPHHARRLRDRSGRLRSLADPAARRFPRAGLPQRTLLQPAGLSPRLDPHSRAAADRLSALSRGQRGIGQGGQALRPQRLYRRTLPDRGRQAPGRQPLPRHPPGRLGRPLRGLRHARILRGLCHHRLAHGGGRLLHRRPRLPRRFVPAPAQPDRGPAARLLADLLAGAVSRRPCSRSSRWCH